MANSSLDQSRVSVSGFVSTCLSSLPGALQFLVPCIVATAGWTGMLRIAGWTAMVPTLYTIAWVVHPYSVEDICLR